MILTRESVNTAETVQNFGNQPYRMSDKTLDSAEVEEYLRFKQIINYLPSRTRGEERCAIAK
jgi:hypothetical protein